jgi:hypothetical protein
MLHGTLTGITIGKRNNKITSIAYADDITIIITSPLDIPAVQTALNIYEKATGARINIGKSKIMAMGKWDTSINIFNIPYYAEMKILGINFISTTEQTVDVNWSIMSDRIKVQAQNAYIRNLTIDKRIQYIHNYLLARVWYTEQVLPLTEEYRRQIETATSWYLWRGSVFRVPLSTLQRRKSKGGWSFVNINVKCRTLLYNRLTFQSQTEESLTADWLRQWDIKLMRTNRPHIKRIPQYLVRGLSRK